MHSGSLSTNHIKNRLQLQLVYDEGSGGSGRERGARRLAAVDQALHQAPNREGIISDISNFQLKTPCLTCGDLCTTHRREESWMGRWALWEPSVSDMRPSLPLDVGQSPPSRLPCYLFIYLCSAGDGTQDNIHAGKCLA